MLKIQRFVFNLFNENTYLIWDENSKTAAVIDPGCNSPEEEKALREAIHNNSLQLKYLINTHCHIDHILGNAFIKKNFDVLFMAPEKDLFMLELMRDIAHQYGVILEASPKPDNFISEEEKLQLGSFEGRFLFTPGHSPGEYCLYFEKEKVCFTGDVLFKGSIGRTDLWEGNFEQLIESIRTKLFILPDDVKIFPGHESQSTIGTEKKSNPFLKAI